MTDSHNYSFFGKSSAILINSSSRNEPYIFIRCIKEKQGGGWEKPSLNEGTVVKFKLEEMVMIERVLSRKEARWSTFHSYKDNETSIRFNWGKTDKGPLLWINIGVYKKPLTIPQVELFRRLMTHMIDEKVEFATGSKFKKTQQKNSKTPSSQSKPQSIPQKGESEGSSIDDLFKEEGQYIPPDVEAEMNMEIERASQWEDEGEIGGVGEKKTITTGGGEKSVITLKARIDRKTAKALLLEFPNSESLWCPKSIVHNQYNEENEKTTQKFMIEEWFAQKNELF